MKKKKQLYVHLTVFVFAHGTDCNDRIAFYTQQNMVKSKKKTTQKQKTYGNIFGFVPFKFYASCLIRVRSQLEWNEHSKIYYKTHWYIIESHGQKRIDWLIDRWSLMSSFFFFLFFSFLSFALVETYLV